MEQHSTPSSNLNSLGVLDTYLDRICRFLEEMKEVFPISF